MTEDKKEEEPTAPVTAAEVKLEPKESNTTPPTKSEETKTDTKNGVTQEQMMVLKTNKEARSKMDTMLRENKVYQETMDMLLREKNVKFAYGQDNRNEEMKDPTDEQFGFVVDNDYSGEQLPNLWQRS